MSLLAQHVTTQTPCLRVEKFQDPVVSLCSLYANRKAIAHVTFINFLFCSLFCFCSIAITKRYRAGIKIDVNSQTTTLHIHVRGTTAIFELILKLYLVDFPPT